MAGKNGKGGGIGTPVIVTLLVLAVATLIIGYPMLKTGSMNPINSMNYWFQTIGVQAKDCAVGAVQNDRECKFAPSADGVGGSGGNGKITGTSQAGKPATKTEEAKTAYNKALENLKISNAEEAEYKPGEWNIWANTGGNCTTRGDVLKAQGKNVTTKDNDPASCSITTGIWTSVYDGKTIIATPENTPNSIRQNVAVDHIIPPEYANVHGGKDWDNAKKEAFANDTTQLLAVSAESAKTKNNQSPAGYMPQPSEQCHYSQLWIDTATKYNLSITQADKAALQKGLETCTQ